jgi:hypothetical protein
MYYKGSDLSKLALVTRGLVQRSEYGAFGISTFKIFNLLPCLFIAIIFIFSTICQMHYVFC